MRHDIHRRIELRHKHTVSNKTVRVSIASTNENVIDVVGLRLIERGARRHDDKRYQFAVVAIYIFAQTKKKRHIWIYPSISGFEVTQTHCKCFGQLDKTQLEPSPTSIRCAGRRRASRADRRTPHRRPRSRSRPPTTLSMWTTLMLMLTSSVNYCVIAATDRRRRPTLRNVGRHDR